MKLLALSLASACLFLAACGGGGAGPAAIAPPLPQTHVVITWSGVGQTLHNLALHPLGIIRPHAQVIGEPIEIANDLGSGTLGYLTNQIQATVSVTVEDSNGNTVPEPPPAVSLSNDIAVLPTPAPGETNPPILVDGSAQTGTDTFNASYNAGALTGSLPVEVYSSLGLSCMGGWSDSAGAYSFASGSPVRVDDPTQADVYVLSPRCTGAFYTSGNPTIYFPYGFEYLPVTPIASFLTAVPFTSVGTSVDGTVLPTNTSATGVVFATSTGQYVKWRIDVYEGADTLEGLMLVSDTNGNFAY